LLCASATQQLIVFMFCDGGVDAGGPTLQHFVAHEQQQLVTSVCLGCLSKTCSNKPAACSRSSGSMLLESVPAWG